MEKVQNRVLQDRRRLSRISVQMECQFKSDDKEYGALLLDLSQGGALLSSTLLPAQQGSADQEDGDGNEYSQKNDDDFLDHESAISITLNASGLKGPMTLSGKIKRRSIGMSEYGKVVQFGVEFAHSPLELLRLISRLSTRRKETRVPTQIDCRYRLGGEEYAARIIDLSQKGALLYSAVIPVLNSKVFIVVEVVELGVPPMTIEGTVTRSAATGDGEEGQFGVEFLATPQELHTLIRILNTGVKKQ
jgi:c-di-GMP-binding flagellar brake protein YcgR